ncbi:MAG: hypothetical protein K2N44_10510, partial [Lachnospiraceae bacterium]|nr:hypothetical protein [Lachnospiraceae bacterium]
IVESKRVHYAVKYLTTAKNIQSLSKKYEKCRTGDNAQNESLKFVIRCRSSKKLSIVQILMRNYTDFFLKLNCSTHK